jgi:phosphohistidine swiveling domain-containing protein
MSVKEYGQRLKINLQAYDEEKLYVSIGYKEDFERFGKYFVKRFLNEPLYLQKLVKWSEKNKDSLKKYLEDNFSKDVEKLDSDKFWKRLNGYVKKYRHFNLINGPSWWMGSDPTAARLKRSLRRFKNADEIFEIITDPLEYKTENLLEELSILGIAIFVKRKGIKKLSEKIRDNGARKMLDKHVDRFSYIPFGYNTGVIWDEKHFIDQINKLLRKDIEKMRKEIGNAARVKIKRRDKKVKELNLSKEEIILAKAVRSLAYLQELKKATQTKSHPVLNFVVYKDLARRLRVPVRTFDYMSYPEIKDALKKGVSDGLLNEIKQRKDVSALVMSDLKYKWIYGEEVKNILRANNFIQVNKNTRVLKGVAASRGFARGRVSVCIFSTQINKIKKGDILVAGMTTPDFVPAMKKAAAIITDEGGITSHAAIVSRELQIPCVIGTKIATKVLRDGDFVEVDADRGVVKIIKRK